MTMIFEIAVKFAILILLLGLTIFFVSAEASLTYLRNSQARNLISEKGVVKLKSWLENPNRLLTTILAGNAMSVIGVSVMGTSIALDISNVFYISRALATVISTVTVLITVLVFSEIAPKAYARRNARRVSAIIIGPLVFINFIMRPVINIFIFLSNIVINLAASKSVKKHSLFAREEIKGLIEIGEHEGVLADSEMEMLNRIMDFSGTVVREIMLPRIAARVLNTGMERKELVREAIKTGHSRLPVYETTPDKIIGVLYVKDLIKNLAGVKDFKIKDILRKPYFVPETKPAAELLKEFKKGREHLAIVVDEYGVMAGIITIEDIMEEITGEIFDEYDQKKSSIQKKENKVWEINAMEDLDKINDKIGIDLPEDKYDSLGGLILGELGRVPAPGEKLRYEEYSFTILDSTPSRIIKVELKLK
ncbi:MAG: hemolysin family protein [Elusimicrobiota bacterium]